MSARDVAVVGVLVFALGIAFFIANFALNTSIDAMITKPHINDSASAVSALNSTKDVAGMFDYVVAGFFFALTLAMFITGWFIGGNVIFMAIYFLIVIISVLISGILANFWVDFSNASVFGTTLTLFPITNHLLSNLQIYVVVVGLIGMVVMFAKPYLTQEAGI